jgi:hypothetical protein
MLAAATTLWAMLSLWLIAPMLGLPRAVRRTAAALGTAELVALLASSYGVEGCAEPTCAPLAQGIGVLARADIPLLAAAFVVAAVARLRFGRALTGQR